MEGIGEDNRGVYILELEAKVRILKAQIDRLKKWIFDEIGREPPESLLSEYAEDYCGDQDQDQSEDNFIGPDSLYYNDNEDPFIGNEDALQEFDLDNVKVENIDDDVNDHLKVVLEEQEQQLENENERVEPHLGNEINERYTFRKRKSDYSFAEENEEDNDGSKPAKLVRAKEFICPTCNKGFTTKYHLKAHEETHNTVREKKYICHCHMAYLYACDLKKHLTRCDIGKKGPLPESLRPVLIPCTVCEETFPNKYSLKRHRATHADRQLGKKSASSSKNKINKTSSAAGNEDPNSIDSNSKDYASDESNEDQDPDKSRYSCSTCNKAFFYKSKLKVHERTHEKTRERIHQCPCGKAYMSVQDLKRHARDYCDVGKNFTFPPTDTRKKGGPFICSICNREFNRNAKLKDHMRTHDGNRKRSNICEFCGKAFYEERHLKRHISLVHPEHSDNPQQRKSDDNVEKLCGICGKIYHSESKLRSHMSYHKSKSENIGQLFICPICGTSVKSSMAYKYHMNLHTKEKTWKCTYPECSGSDKVYFHQHNLKLHILRIHTKNVQTFNCDFPGCNRKFKLKSGLKWHKNDFHNTLQYKCEYCEKILISTYSLRRHIGKYHRQERSGPDYPFKCQVPACGQNFKEERWLKLHFDKYHGEKRIKLTCPHGCKSVFLTQTTLRLHMKWRHQLAGVRPFVCQIDNCNKRFQVKAQLKQHQDTHVTKEERNYKCKYCQENFFSRTVLNDHIRNHHKDVRNFRFKCQIENCGQSFNSIRYLEEHAETHSPDYDPYKFKCSICSKGYKISTERNRHEKIVHQNERPFKCSQCPKDFKRFQHLQRHESGHEDVGKMVSRKRKFQDNSSHLLDQHEPNY